MNTHGKEMEVNRRQSVPNTFFATKNNSSYTFKFLDNRPEAVAQRRLQAMADNSLHTKHATQLQAMGPHDPARQQQSILKKDHNAEERKNGENHTKNDSGAQPAVVQGFWRDTGGEKNWVDDNLFFDGWYDVLIEEYVAKRTVKKTGKLKKHKDTRNVKYWSVYRPKSRDVYTLNPAIAPHISTLEGWFVRLGVDKGQAIFTAFNMAKATERNWIARHLDSFVHLTTDVVARLMARKKDDVSVFLDRLSAAQFLEYFQNDEVSQQKMVGSDNEFSSLIDLMTRQDNFDRTAVLKMNPTAYQGSHFLSEHGSYRSKHQTIHLALAYAHRTGGNQSTKGNWASNELQKAAMDWSINRVNLQIAIAKAANTAPSSLAAIAGIQGSNAPIFGVPATETASVATAVGSILVNNNWEHGTVSGSPGNAEVVLSGNFQHPASPMKPGVYSGTFRGSLTGAALANGATAPNQDVRIDNVEGNGNVTTDIAATAIANKRLTGVIHGNIAINNAYINMRLGAGPFTRYFDGKGNFTGMAAGDINPANTAFTYGYRQLTGKVFNQQLGDKAPGGNRINNIKGDVAGANTGSMFSFGVGSNLKGAGTGYTPGLSTEIRSGIAGAKAQNLQANVTNHSRGVTFNPQSLRDLVDNATIAGKPNTYVRITNAFGGQAADIKVLLVPNLTVTGTLADLQAAYPANFNAVTDLSSLTIQIDQLTKGEPDDAVDIDEEATPIAGNTYKAQINGQWHSFRLASYNPGPGQTNFGMLLHLKDANSASYEVFTGYPH